MSRQLPPRHPRRGLRHAVLAAALLAACSDAVSVTPANIMADQLVVDGPGAVSPGDTVHVRVASHALGGVPSWKIRIYLSSDWIITPQDVPLGDLVAVPISPGGPALTEGAVRIPPGTPPGRYLIGAVADPDAQQPDSTREDNAIVAGPWLGVGIPPSSVADAPTLLAPGDRFESSDSDSVAFTWTFMPRTLWYELEVDECPEPTDAVRWWSGCVSWNIRLDRLLRVPELFYSFPHNEVARWRVRAVDSLMIAGPASGWQVFRIQ